MEKRDFLSRMVLDIEKTFGELIFLEYEKDYTKRNQETEEEEAYARCYNVLCPLHEEVLSIAVPLETPMLEYPRMTKVKIDGEVNLTFIPRTHKDLSDVMLITVDNLVKVEDKPKVTTPSQQGAVSGK